MAASCVANWLAALKNNNRAILQAASAAQKAVGYLDSLHPEAARPDSEQARRLFEPRQPNPSAPVPNSARIDMILSCLGRVES
jgi:hypothetical protein